MFVKFIATAFFSYLLAQGAFAAKTPQQTITSIEIVTTISKNANGNLGELTPPSNLSEASEKSRTTVQSLQSIATNLTQDITAMQSTPPYTGGAAQSVADANAQLVNTQQALLATVIGKHEIFAQFGQTAPLAAALRHLEATLDSFEVSLISLIPSHQSDVISRKDQLDASLAHAITLYEQLCIPSPLYPDVPPTCVAI